MKERGEKSVTYGLLAHGAFLTIGSIGLTLTGNRDGPFLFVVAMFHFVIKLMMGKIPWTVDYAIFLIGFISVVVTSELYITEFPN